MIFSTDMPWNEIKIEVIKGEVVFSWACPYCKKAVEGVSCDCGAGLRAAVKKDWTGGTTF